MREQGDSRTILKVSDEGNSADQRLVLSIFAGVVCLFLFWLGILGYIRWSKEIWEKDERARIMEVLIESRSKLENELFARIYYTKSVAAYVSLNPDIAVDEFDNLASELVGEDEVINSMSISPKGVISAVYPRMGREAAIGLNLLEHPERKKIVEQTIFTGKTYIAGPVELVEGGMAFISYTPIFNKTTPRPWDFWGMTDIVIFRDGLFEAAGLSSTLDGAEIALRGYDGLGADGAVIFGDPEVFNNSPVELSVQLPDGQWILAGAPVLGWDKYLDQDITMLLLMVGSSVVIAVLVAILVSAILKLRSSRRELQSLNDDKNRLISIIAHDLRSPVSAVAHLTKELLEPRENGLDGESREMAELIEGSSEDSLMLLENLLDWVRSREKGLAVQVSEIDLPKVLAQTVSMFQFVMRNKSLVIRERVPAGTVVYGDTRVLQTILTNLISNATKFSPEGGQIEVGVRPDEDGRVMVYVLDQGAGMKPATIDKILNGQSGESSAGSGSDQSSGLGLALCRDLLARNGQKLLIESKEGEGTTVSFSFPTTDPR